MTQTPEQFQICQFDYQLPSSLIAQRPMAHRSDSRLLVYDHENDQITHAHFRDLAQFLPVDPLLVFNNSKVFACRLLGHKETGGKCEVFILSLYPEQGLYPALVKTSGKKKLGEIFQFAGDSSLQLELVGTAGDGSFLVKPVGVTHEQFQKYLSENGLVPIPPYIREGAADGDDREQYQTVYARHEGSVAAPTAGLHFTPELLQGLKQAYVTLHVGAGTFKPVHTSDIREHQMHTERYILDGNEQKKIKSHQGSIFAVGTTSLRVLETEFRGMGQEGDGFKSTDIFLYPGEKISSVDGLITNFHLPKSSLFMLVCAYVGTSKAHELYQKAIAHKYRFYSYGDAMLILKGRR